jgi:hypothetical protein
MSDRGRPPKPDEERREFVVTLRFSEREYKRLKKHAHKKRDTPARLAMAWACEKLDAEDESFFTA